MTTSRRVTPGERIRALKDVIAQKGFARILEAHSGLSAIVAETARVTLNGEVR